MAAHAAEQPQADRGHHHQHQQEPQVRDQFPGEGVIFFVQRQVVPGIRFAFYVLQHNKLRQREQGNSGEHRDADALDAHFPPPFKRVAQKKHVGKIARNNEKDLHPEGMDKIVE
ncbi:hypothetical protein D3C76_1341670 [compost metagenome]